MVDSSRIFVLRLFPATLAACDLVSRHKVQRVTWIGSLMLLVMWLTRIPIGQTAPRQAFARMLHG